MKRLAVFLSSLALALPSVSHGAAGFFDGFTIVYSTLNAGSGSSTTYYDTGAVTGNPEFQSTILGTFNRDQSGNLQLGGQQKTFKNNGTDVTGEILSYRVWSGSPGGSFSDLAYAFQIDNVGGVGGDQQWGTDVVGANGSLIQTGNLLSGLANGNYTLEVFSRVTTNGVNEAGTVFNNVGGANYTATFTVVPEPSRALLLMAGVLGCFLRRRR